MVEKTGCKGDYIKIDGRCQKVNNITISAKRWFDKTAGNTYHSIDVFVNGTNIGSNDFTYGYGEQYLQTAHDILVKNGLYSYKRTKALVEVKDKSGKHLYDTPLESKNKQDSYYKFLWDKREHPKKFVVVVSDVGRKKDL